MKSYTVIVGRPDYITDDPINDTYMTSIFASSVRFAQNEAKREAWVEDNQGGDEEDAIGEPDDYVIIAVIEGKHEDIKEGR